MPQKPNHLGLLLSAFDPDVKPDARALLSRLGPDAEAAAGGVAGWTRTAARERDFVSLLPVAGVTLFAGREATTDNAGVLSAYF